MALAGAPQVAPPEKGKCRALLAELFGSASAAAARWPAGAAAARVVAEAQDAKTNTVDPFALNAALDEFGLDKVNTNVHSLLFAVVERFGGTCAGLLARAAARVAGEGEEEAGEGPPPKKLKASAPAEVRNPSGPRRPGAEELTRAPAQEQEVEARGGDDVPMPEAVGGEGEEAQAAPVRRSGRRRQPRSAPPPPPGDADEENEVDDDDDEDFRIAKAAAKEAEEEEDEAEEEEAEEEEEEGAGPELPQVGTLAEAEAAVRRDPTGFRLPTIVPKSFQAAQAHARQHLELLRAGKLDSFDEME